MKQGKLTENVLKRSVLRRIGTYREEMQKGAALGQDCAFFSWKEETLATTTQTAALPVKDAGRLAVYAADNNLAAAGAQTIGISLVPCHIPPSQNPTFLFLCYEVPSSYPYSAQTPDTS